MAPTSPHPIPSCGAGPSGWGLNAGDLDDRTNARLLDLDETYSERGQNAATDVDDRRSPDASNLTSPAGRAGQAFFQRDKDWRCRAEEGRWVRLNTRRSWRKAGLVEGEPSVSVFHIR